MLIMRTSWTLFHMVFHEAPVALLFSLTVECSNAIWKFAGSLHFLQKAVFIKL